MTLADNLANFSTVITSATTWITDTMTVFTEPPLSIFVGLGIAFVVLKKVGKLMKMK